MVTWQHRHIIRRVEPVARKAVSNVAPPSVTIEKKVAGEFLDMVVSRYFSFFLREAGTSSRRN